MKAKVGDLEKAKVLRAQGNACFTCGTSFEELLASDVFSCFIYQPLLDEAVARRRWPFAICQVCIGFLRHKRFDTFKAAIEHVLVKREESGREMTKRLDIAALTAVWEMSVANSCAVTRELRAKNLMDVQKAAEIAAKTRQPLSAASIVQELNETPEASAAQQTASDSEVPPPSASDASHPPVLAMPPLEEFVESKEETGTLRVLKQFGLAPTASRSVKADVMPTASDGGGKVQEQE